MLYKLGAVSYWNALPLIHYLKDPVTLAAPAALSRLLKIGEVDVATAPIVTFFENPHYTMVPGVCIGARGPVQSVKLFFQSPELNASNVRSIYLDMESKTSILLLKVLLQFKYKRDLGEITFFHPLPPRSCEAKLLIGDKAMKEVPISAPLDLGAEWTEWTGLPFVFAAWLSRHPTVSEKAIWELQAARDAGVKNIASVIPPNIPLPFETIKKYLENLNYTLETQDIEGMNLFRNYLREGGFLKNP